MASVRTGLTGLEAEMQAVYTPNSGLRFGMDDIRTSLRELEIPASMSVEDGAEQMSSLRKFSQQLS